MDGENNGSKPYEQMDDLGGFPTPIFGLTSIWEIYIYTPPKTNMEPENGPLEKEIPIGNHHFQVPC